MKKLILLAIAAALLNGCAAVGLAVMGAGAGVAVGTGVEHTMSGITYKTFAASHQDLQMSVIDALDRMDMELQEVADTEEGSAIVATAVQRRIEIDLEKLSAGTTRMRVVANKGDIFFKDSATATEIILQTAQSLDDHKAKLAARPKPVPVAKTRSPKKTATTPTPISGDKKS
jgi:hypothetical protein